MMPRRTRVIAGMALLFLFAAFAGLCLAAYFLFEARERLALERAAVLRASQHVEELTKLERELEETTADRDTLRSFFLHEEGIIDFLSLIETLGTGYGTEVSTAAITATEESAQFTILRIGINASGSLAGVLHVLESLETLPYASHIEQASVQSGGAAGALFEGDFTLSVVQYNGI